MKVSKVGSRKCSIENGYARRPFKNLVLKRVDMIEWEKLGSTIENENILVRNEHKDYIRYGWIIRRFLTNHLGQCLNITNKLAIPIYPRPAIRCWLVSVIRFVVIVKRFQLWGCRR